jgi:hypothetical protein
MESDKIVHVLKQSLPDITVELASRDGCFLMDVSHLILEARLNNRVNRVNLLSRESMPGVWVADDTVFL